MSTSTPTRTEPDLCEVCGSPYKHYPLTAQSVSLVDGLRVEYRIARGGGADEIAPAWEPWRIGEISVQRIQGLKGKAATRNGMLSVLTLRDLNWADYGPDDYDETHNVWLVEDYYLQLRETLTIAPQALVDAVKAAGTRL